MSVEFNNFDDLNDFIVSHYAFDVKAYHLFAKVCHFLP